MEYLRGNATASAVGLFVICRHLVAYSDGQTEDDLRRSLQPLRARSMGSSGSGPVLTASLAVGEGLGVIERDGNAGPWTIDSEIGTALQSEEEPWPWFRGALLHRMTQHAVQELESEGKIPDLILGLTWFLQLNPLEPPQTAWGAGPERIVRSLGFEAVSNSEQWRPFQRWALAVGLARRAGFGNAKVIIPDASVAIADLLGDLPPVATAREWLSRLRDRLPVLGLPALTAQLPLGGDLWSDLPPGLALGLLKLEKAGVLMLQPSDDAADVVALSLATSTRQIGRITVEQS